MWILNVSSELIEIFTLQMEESFEHLFMISRNILHLSVV
jgi:hypothetical protein